MNKVNNKRDLIPFQNIALKKSNTLIGTKYKASNLENKITYLAMLKIQDREFNELSDGIYVKMTAGEIKDAVKMKGGSFYQALKIVANNMTGNNYGIVDDEHERFEFITLINKASYEDGEFTIRFANELKTDLIGINSNFTKLPKQIVMKMKKPYSFPLYQLLKSQCYYPANYRGDRHNVFLVTIGLSELKLDIGVVNINAYPDVKKALLSGKGVTEDYDRAVEKSPDQMFKSWSTFSRDCLQPTVNELNNISDIYIEYKPKRGGIGGKIYAVEFTVWLEGSEKVDKPITPVVIDENGNINNNLSEMEKYIFYTTVIDLFKEYNLKIEDAIFIASESGFSMDTIQNAKIILDKQKNISNVTGWIIDCIRKNYTLNSKETTNTFENIENREYDFEKLEKELLKKNY